MSELPRCPKCGSAMFEDEWQPTCSDPIKFEMLECTECDESGYKIDYELAEKKP